MKTEISIEKMEYDFILMGGVPFINIKHKEGSTHEELLPSTIKNLLKLIKLKYIEHKNEHGGHKYDVLHNQFFEIKCDEATAVTNAYELNLELSGITLTGVTIDHPSQIKHGDLLYTSSSTKSHNITLMKKPYLQMEKFIIEANELLKEFT